MIKSITKICALILTSAILFTASGVQAAVSGPQALRIQALPVGGSWYVFAATYSKLLQAALPEGSTVDVLAKGGSLSNYIAVDKGQVDASLTNVVAAIWGTNGDKDAYKGVTYNNARAIAGGINSAYVAVMARKEFLEKSGQKTLEEILTSGKPVRIVLKPVGSAPAIMLKKIMDALGTSNEQIKKNGGNVINVGVDQIPSMLRDGQADVYIELAVSGNPAINEICLTSNVEFLDMPKKFLDAESAKGQTVSEMPVIFKSQTKPIPTFDMGCVMVVNKSMSDDMAYLMAKVFNEKIADLRAASKAWENLDPKKCAQPGNTGIELHPGAAKYYREQNWIK